MIAALARFVLDRSPRERWLLLALALAVPALLVLALGLSLRDQRAAAALALQGALDEQAWYRARQTEIAALPGPGEALPRAPVAPVGLGGIEARLIEAGLRPAVDLLSNLGGDSVALAFTAVPFGALMGWLDAIEAGAGYRVASLRLSAGDSPGIVGAELRLDPVRGGGG